MPKTKYVVDDNMLELEHLKGFIRKSASSNIKECIPTGHFQLDFLIHNGEIPDNVDLNKLVGYNPSEKLGIPLGKVVEFFGEEGSGKSSLAYRVVGSAQKMGLPCAWIDTENSFSDDLAIINGANKDELYYSNLVNYDDVDKLFYAEDVFNAIILLCKNGMKVIVLDSVANLVSKARMEKSAEEVTVATVARLMSENLGKIVNYAAKYGTLIIFINQLRDKIGIQFGSSETTPGGHSLKHNSSLRIRLSKKSGKEADINIVDVNGKERLIGRKAYVRIPKNRFAKPYFAAIEIPIFYEPYFPDIEEMMFEEARRLKIVSVRKGEYKWRQSEDNEITALSKKLFIDLIKSNNYQVALSKDIDNKAKEMSSILPPELTKWINENITNVVVGVENEKEISGRRKRKNSDLGEAVAKE